MLATPMRTFKLSLTETECATKNLATDPAKHELPCIFNAIDFRVPKLERADDIA